jgi:formate dehydrogenase subunit gamma
MHSSTAPRLIAALLTTFTLLWASAQSSAPEVKVTSTAAAASALAATGASMTTAPAGFVAPAEPKPDDSNAERAKSQPGNNAPFWRGVRESGVEKGISNLPGAEKGVLIQEFVQYPGSRLASAGEAWRQVRNKWIIPYGGSLFVITLLALALFYFKMGSLGGHVPYTGRVIERFTYFERAAHWSNAIAFCALAISGLVMAFGKFLLLPVIGASLFGWLTFALKNVHNFAGPLFAVSLVVVFLTFVRDNIPNLADLTWLRKGGGMFGGEEVPSGRFNAGEKVVFWGGIFTLGSVVIGSGLVLDELVPGMAYLRGDMQIANMVHGVATVLMMAMFAAHIYLGTIGMKDAYNGMKTGLVDEGWAKEHHELWFDDVRSGKVPYQRTLPAEAKAANAAKPA